MAFNVTVTGFGSFTATVNGEQAVLAAQVMDQSALLATMAAQGAKGDKGDTGATGSQGPQGPQGNPGASATVNAGTTTTGAAGSSASVVNVGTTSAAIFDFTIPRGDKGEQGIQGIQGIQGEKGDTGDSGVAYATSPLAYDAPTKTVSINSTSPDYSSLMASTFGLPTYAGSPQITVNTAGTNTILGRDSLYAKWFTGSEVADIIGLGSAAYAATSDFYASTNPSGYVDAAGALAAVPSASTTVQGKVELATETEVIAGQSTTTVPTTKGALMAAEYGYLKRKFFDFVNNANTQATGTGYSYQQLPAYQNIVGAASTAGFARAYTVLLHPNPVVRPFLYFFNGKWSFGQGLYLVNTSATVGFTVVSRLGISNSPTAGVALPADDTTTKHFGWKYVVGSSVKLQVFDGTTYQETDTGYTPSSFGSQPVYILCWSDGAGTAYIEITKPDGSIVTASRTGCPTGAATSATNQTWVLQVAGTGAQTGALNLNANPVMFSADW